MSIFKNTLIGSAANIFVLMALFINSIFIIKILGPRLQGMYFLIVTTNGIIINFLNFGLNISNTTFIAKKRYTFSQMNANTIVFALGISFIAILTYLLSYKFLHAHVFKDISPIYILISVCLLPFSMYEVLWSAMMVGLNKIRLMNSLILVKNIAGLLLNIVALLILKLGFHGIFYVWIFVTVCSAFMMLLIGKRYGLKMGFYPEVFKDTVLFGVKNYIGNIATTIWKGVDIYIINIFSGVLVVGYYSLAVTLRDLVLRLIESISKASFADISKLDREESSWLTSKIVRHTIWNSFLIAAFFAIASYSGIKLMFTQYLSSILPCMILLVGSIGIGISMILSTYIIGQIGKPGLVAFFAWINAAIDLVLCLVFIPRYSIVGAAIASIITSSFGAFIMLAAFKKFSNRSIADTVLMRKEDFLYYYKVLKNIKLACPNA